MKKFATLLLFSVLVSGCGKGAGHHSNFNYIQVSIDRDSSGYIDAEQMVMIAGEFDGYVDDFEELEDSTSFKYFAYLYVTKDTSLTELKERIEVSVNNGVSITRVDGGMHQKSIDELRENPRKVLNSQ